MAECLVGLDISYSALGMCALPLDFVDGTEIGWRRALFKTAPKQVVSALARDILARDVRTFAVMANATLGRIRGLWVEGLAIQLPKSANRVADLAKLHAIVEHELYREFSMEMKAVNQSSARKLMYGRGIPPKGLTPKQRKAWLTEPLVLAGAPIVGDAQGDALTIANFGLSELGSPCLTGLLFRPEAAE